MTFIVNLPFFTPGKWHGCLFDNQWLMRSCYSKILTSNMALKQGHRTAEIAENDTKMGWNCHSDREKHKLIQLSKMPTVASLPPQHTKTSGFEIQTRDIHWTCLREGGKGGSRSCFMGWSFHNSRKIKFRKFRADKNSWFMKNLVSRKIILQNQASLRLLWKLRLTRNNQPIIKRKKRADHESWKYPLPPS